MNLNGSNLLELLHRLEIHDPARRAQSLARRQLRQRRRRMLMTAAGQHPLDTRQDLAQIVDQRRAAVSVRQRVEAVPATPPMATVLLEQATCWTRLLTRGEPPLDQSRIFLRCAALPPKLVFVNALLQSSDRVATSLHPLTRRFT
jgi:hypothetical protein